MNNKPFHYTQISYIVCHGKIYNVMITILIMIRNVCLISIKSLCHCRPDREMRESLYGQYAIAEGQSCLGWGDLPVPVDGGQPDHGDGQAESVLAEF